MGKDSWYIGRVFPCVYFFFSIEMPPKLSDFWRGYVTALSDAKYSQTQIIAMCKRRDFAISKKGIYCALRRNAVEGTAAVKPTPGPHRQRRAPKRTAEVVRKVRKLVNVENPPTQ